MTVRNFMHWFLFCFTLLFVVAVVCLDANAQSKIEQGRQLYLSHGCAVCHGEKGDGKSIVPRRLDPSAIDFHDAGAYRYGHDKSSIMASIKRGAKQPGSVMPAYDHLSDDELEGIASYLESLISEKGVKGDQAVVFDAWVRWQPPSRPNSAAFMTIKNQSLQQMTVTSVSSREVERIELHDMEHADGIMRMRQVNTIAIPPSSEVELKSGGLHLMLFGIQKPLAAGEKIPLTLTFQDGSVVEVEAVVKGQDEE